MSELTKQQLTVENNSSFPNNNTGFITPTLLRTFNQDMIDSMVDEVTYNADSASWESDILALQQFSASLSTNFVSDTEFNQYTQSQTAVSASFNSRINAVTGSTPAGTISSSAQIAGLGYATTSSVSQSVSALNSATSSYITSAQTSSMTVLSASFAITSSETRNVVVIARNGNTATLGVGTVVHITGASGDNPIFNTASFNSEALSSNTLGILRTSLASGADGEVVVNGIVTGVNTDPALGYVAGDIIYLSASGQFTRVQPQAPQNIVVLGQVLRAQQNNGSIYVSINNGWELGELHDVRITNPQNGQTLVYSASLWINSSSAAGNVDTGSLVTTASFNTYTASAATAVSASINAATSSLSASLTLTDNGKLNTSSFNTYTSSVTTQISGLGLQINARLLTSSFNTYTQSNDARVNALISSTGSYITSGQTSSMSVLSSSYAVTASFALNAGGAINTGSFATTGSNTFKDTQTIELSTTSIITASAIIGNTNAVITDMYVNGGNFDTFNVLVSASNGVFLRDYDGVNTIPFLSVDTNGGHVRIPRNTNITGSLNVSASLGGDEGNIIRGGVTIVGNNLGNAIAVNSGSVAITSPQGAGFFYSNLPITSSGLRINGTALVNDLIVSGVFGGNSSVNVIGALTASVISASSYIGIPSVDTASFATTGSNTFVGNQVITGSVILSSSAAIELTVLGNQSNSGSIAITGSAPTQLWVSGGLTLSGSLLTNATDIYTGSNNANFVVTLGSASMASLLAAGTTNPNTLYFVI